MPKCKVCSSKINKLFVQIYTCKCENIYCSTHMHYHGCTYDYKKDVVEKVKSQAITKEKVVKI